MTLEEPLPTRTDTIERQRWVEHERAARSRLRRAPALVSAHGPGWEQRHWTSRALHRVGEMAGRASAGMFAAGLVVGWVVLGALRGFPDWWQTVLYSVTASVTFVMVFVIQHTNERQTSAMQRKLDELIRSSAPADDALIAVEGSDDDHLHALAGLNVADRESAIAPVTDQDPPADLPSA